MDMNDLPTTGGNEPTVQQLADVSSPPPPSVSKLNPRNLTNDLDTFMPELPSFEESMAMVMPPEEQDAGHKTPNLKHPTTIAPQDKRGETTGTQQSYVPQSNTEYTAASRPIKEPVHAAEFRQICGNPVDVEDRLKHLEHHIALLVANNRAADERAKKEANAAAMGELQLAAKAEELHTL